jgi:hypothetical protein
VVGLFARKCRGEGPAGLFQLDPAVFPDLTSVRHPACPIVETLADGPRQLITLFHAPPTPPPRRF